ncbi:HAD family hydrolase [bacterium]|nr:HAD family hydrolase [bacterium]
MKQKAVFLDRDGTIIIDKVYLNDPKQVEFLPGAIDGLKELKRAGYLLIVVTNQSGIARGLVQKENLEKIHQRMQDLLKHENIQIDGFFYSPHAADSNHPMRKPNPGMLLQAAKEHRINLAASFMIGDKPIDVEAGHRAGVKSVLIGSALDSSGADFVAADLGSAAQWILRKS